jgi:5-formyltetrahydrofolate cyclo-ligase
VESRVPPSAEKSALRRAARASRDAVPVETRPGAAIAAAAHLDREVLAGLAPGALIALYAAKSSEIDTTAIGAAALARGLAVAYPRVVPGDRRLAFHRASPADLAPGTFGLLEPPPSAPVVTPHTMAVVVLPGLAFDRRGNRLGWGQGHYDATLADAQILRVGLAYESQLVDQLPADEHDVPVHLIATEVAVHRTSDPIRVR